MSNGVMEVCWCGHAKETHFEKSGACLGMHCDDCKMYRDRLKPDPKKGERPARPRHAAWCLCAICRLYADDYAVPVTKDDDAVDTPRLPSWPVPWGPWVKP